MKEELYKQDEYGRSYVTRYVVTQRNKEWGGRKLATAQQGGYTFATKEEAEQHMWAIMQNNSLDILESIFNLPLKVLPCPCYPVHFDPIGIYFEEE